MLSRSNRLPAHIRLHKVSYEATPYFTVGIANNDLAVSRFGFIVSKRTAKQATKRNRVKRIVRSCIEELLPQIKPGHDILFSLRTNDLEEKHDLVREIIITIFTKHQLLV